MIYKEEIRDLFSVPDDYYLAHCISADFALGKGVAVEFNNRFAMRRLLQSEYPGYLAHFHDDEVLGDCLLIDRVFNLVTKERYWHKPTYQTLARALDRMRNICDEKDIKKVAMPMIGCGLDKLEWQNVSMLICDAFKAKNVEILICRF